jgi:predicted nucleotidyltransferase
MRSKHFENLSMARIKLAADFKDFLKLCLLNKVRFMMIGGYAVIHYSRPRYTGDLDLWIDSSEDNARRVIAVLVEFGFKQSEVPIELITQDKKIIRMGFEPMRLELFTHIPGVEFDQCYERHEVVKIGKMTVPIISLDDLKVNKLASGRAKDLQDLEELP